MLHPVDGRTYPSPLPRRMLDFVLLPRACSRVESQVLRVILSDHCPVLVDFDLE